MLYDIRRGSLGPDGHPATRAIANRADKGVRNMMKILKQGLLFSPPDSEVRLILLCQIHSNALADRRA
jgi:hypothetical protein